MQFLFISQYSVIKPRLPLETRLDVLMRYVLTDFICPIIETTKFYLFVIVVVVETMRCVDYFY